MGQSQGGGDSHGVVRMPWYLDNVTPPVAPIFYLACRIGNVTVDKVMRPALTFMILGTIPVRIAATYWPDLALALPRLLMPQIMGGGQAGTGPSCACGRSGRDCRPRGASLRRCPARWR